MKIGIYGGTFNPIHMGHISAARFAVDYLGLDQLCLIPTGIPPHKQLTSDAPSPEHRLAMAQLAAEAIGPQTRASGVELHRQGRSYTIDTLRELKKEHQGDRLYLLMGADMFLTFQNWRSPGEIAGLCTLCAFGRSEADTEELFAVQRDYLHRTFGAEIVTLVLPHITDISSTRLRGSLELGGGREYLDPAVYGYILRKGLYGVRSDLKRLGLEDLRCAALSMLSRRRVPHVLGTEETAASLARRWGADEMSARRAALLHDCTKKCGREQHLAICRQYGIRLDEEEQREEKLLHALTGAALAEHVFGLTAEEVGAVRWHTTGRAGMTVLEKILYLADYIEPTRDFCDLREIRTLAYEDLDRAVLMGLEMSIREREAQGAKVHVNSVYARDHLKGKLT